MGENICNEMTDEHLILKIYKWLTQLNIKEKLKWAEDLNRHFFSKNTYRKPANT